ncbi:restriction endonuclease subunit S [Oerskovia sp. USHLN155]|uniref:restriction endonuclease subunit S n=1 Tax=Oerskovia sp. USHLN155 TaxID=3081288 RepID=UPI003017B806
MSSARYPAYQSSDWPTFNELPAHWRVVRGRHLVTIQTGSGDTVDAEDGGQYPFYVRSDTPLRSSGWEFDTRAVLTAGDGAGVAKVFHLVSGKFMAHQRVYVLHDFREVTPEFFFYAFRSMFYLMALDGSAKSTVDSVRRHMIADMPFGIPPIDEQLAIAGYLDHETTQIDALVAKQEELIRHLGERRLAVITTTALRGLRGEEAGQHDVKRWGSSLAVEPWLARAPRSWGVERFKTVCPPRDERNVAGTELMLSLTVKGLLIDRSTMAIQQNASDASIPRYFVTRPGDLVVNPMWLTGGAIGVSDKRGAVSPDYRVFEIAKALDPWYLHAVLRSAPYFDQYRLYTRSNTTFDRRIKQNDLDNLPLPIPPIDEQHAIVEHIDEQTSRIDALIAKAEEHIALAKERRSALITAAVTGQIDIRTARKAS